MGSRLSFASPVELAAIPDLRAPGPAILILTWPAGMVGEWLAINAYIALRKYGGMAFI